MLPRRSPELEIHYATSSGCMALKLASALSWSADAGVMQYLQSMSYNPRKEPRVSFLSCLLASDWLLASCLALRRRCDSEHFLQL